MKKTDVEKINLRTNRHAELIEITDKIQALVAKSKAKDGICHVFVPHTTAGVTINENADPSVRQDILNTFERLIPTGAGYSHAEGNADAHVKSSVTGSSLSVFIEDGQLCLGTWQGIFFLEGDGPRSRQVWVKIISKDA